MRVNNISSLALLSFSAKNKVPDDKKIVKFPTEYKTYSKEDLKAIDDKALREKSFLGINIVKPMSIIVPTKRAGSFTAFIYPDTIRKFLSDEQGKNQGYVEKFTSTFIKVAQQLEAQYEYEELEPEIVEGEAKEAEPVTIALALDDEEEKALEDFLGVKMDDPEFINILVERVLKQPILSQANLYFENHPDETYELDEDSIEDLSQRAYRAAIGLFELSKTDTGYDFSFEDEKLRLLSYAERLEYRYGSVVLDDLINNSIRKDGSIDYNFACETAEIIEQSDIDTSVKKAADTYRKFIELNPERKEQILKALICTNMGNFALVDDDNEFEEVFSLCFDKQGRFSTPRFEAIYGIDEAAGAWLDEIEATDFEFPFYRNFIKLTMEDYIEKNTDKEGVFTGSEEAARRYFEQAQKPYILKN